MLSAPIFIQGKRNARLSNQNYNFGIGVVGAPYTLPY
jgi:hypothetical protein